MAPKKKKGKAKAVNKTKTAADKPADNSLFSTAASPQVNQTDTTLNILNGKLPSLALRNKDENDSNKTTNHNSQVNASDLVMKKVKPKPTSSIELARLNELLLHSSLVLHPLDDHPLDETGIEEVSDCALANQLDSHSGIDLQAISQAAEMAGIDVQAIKQAAEKAALGCTMVREIEEMAALGYKMVADAEEVAALREQITKQNQQLEENQRDLQKKQAEVDEAKASLKSTKSEFEKFKKATRKREVAERDKSDAQDAKVEDFMDKIEVSKLLESHLKEDSTRKLDVQERAMKIELDKKEKECQELRASLKVHKPRIRRDEIALIARTAVRQSNMIHDREIMQLREEKDAEIQVKDDQIKGFKLQQRNDDANFETLYMLYEYQIAMQQQLDKMVPCLRAGTEAFGRLVERYINPHANFEAS